MEDPLLTQETARDLEALSQEPGAETKYVFSIMSHCSKSVWWIDEKSEKPRTAEHLESWSGHFDVNVSLPSEPSLFSAVFSSLSLGLLPERSATLMVYEDVVQIVSGFQGMFAI